MLAAILFATAVQHRGVKGAITSGIRSMERRWRNWLPLVETLRFIGRHIFTITYITNIVRAQCSSVDLQDELEE